MRMKLKNVSEETEEVKEETEEVSAESKRKWATKMMMRMKKS